MVKVSVPLLVPEQTVALDATDPPAELGFTVISNDAIEFPELFGTVYLIVEFPGATHVTTPVPGTIVATEGVPLLQVPPKSPLLLKLMVEPTHPYDAPVIVPEIGTAFTVIFDDAVDVPQLFVMR